MKLIHWTLGALFDTATRCANMSVSFSLYEMQRLTHQESVEDPYSQIMHMSINLSVNIENARICGRFDGRK